MKYFKEGNAIFENYRFWCFRDKTTNMLLNKYFLKWKFASRWEFKRDEPVMQWKALRFWERNSFFFYHFKSKQIWKLLKAFCCFNYALAGLLRSCLKARNISRGEKNFIINLHSSRQRKHLFSPYRKHYNFSSLERKNIVSLHRQFCCYVCVSKQTKKLWCQSFQ